MAKGKTTKHKWSSDLPSTREWQDRTRAKIKAGMLIERLEGCAEGKHDMTASQVTAAKTLLDRVMPSLTSADVINRPAEDRTFDEVKAEMLTKYGPDLTSLLLGEITPGEYATRIFQQSSAIQADTKPAELVADTSNHIATQ